MRNKVHVAEEFKAWCIAHGKPLNGKSRCELATELAGAGKRDLMKAIERLHLVADAD
ncbi:MAG: hypothetical protein ACOH2R_05680 [Pseudomonas sp.]